MFNQVFYLLFYILFFTPATPYLLSLLRTLSVSPIPDIQIWKHHLIPRDPAASPVLGRASSAISQQSSSLSLSLSLSCSVPVPVSSLPLPLSSLTLSLSLSLTLYYLQRLLYCTPGMKNTVSLSACSLDYYYYYYHHLLDWPQSFVLS